MIALTGLLAVPVPSASATLLPSQPSSATLLVAETFGSASNSAGSIRGGCFLAAIQDPNSAPGVNHGVIGIVAVTTDASGLPVAGSVTCTLLVNGVGGPGPSAAGDGGQFGVEERTFVAMLTDTVTLCEDATINGIPVPQRCSAATTQTATTPQIVTDTFVSTVDPVACPVLSTIGSLLSGGLPPTIKIAPDGDVYVDDLGLGLNPVYDCPEYGDY